jgi:hypothetical protein
MGRVNRRLERGKENEKKFRSDVKVLAEGNGALDGEMQGIVLVGTILTLGRTEIAG